MLLSGTLRRQKEAEKMTLGYEDPGANTDIHQEFTWDFWLFLIVKGTRAKDWTHDLRQCTCG